MVGSSVPIQLADAHIPGGAGFFRRPLAAPRFFPRILLLCLAVLLTLLAGQPALVHAQTPPEATLPPSGPGPQSEAVPPEDPQAGARPAALLGEILLHRGLRAESQAASPAGERPREDLPPGTSVAVGRSLWRVSGVRSLRLTSPDAGAFAVLQYRPLPAGSEQGWVLNIIIVGEQDPQEFRYKAYSQQAVEGKIEPLRQYRLTEGREAGLLAGGLPVREIFVLDDGQAEVRARLAGEVLEIEALTRAHGGQPDGRPRVPPYLWKTLRHLDSTLSAGGYTDNFFLEVVALDHLLLRGNYLSGAGTEAYLGRLEVTASPWRNEWMALWLHGGAAVFGTQGTGANPASDETWVGGMSLHFRWGDWGLALEMDQVDDTGFLGVSGGWNVWGPLAVLLYYQSYQGVSGYGLGGGLAF